MTPHGNARVCVVLRRPAIMTVAALCAVVHIPAVGFAPQPCVRNARHRMVIATSVGGKPARGRRRNLRVHRPRHRPQQYRPEEHCDRAFASAAPGAARPGGCVGAAPRAAGGGALAAARPAQHRPGVGAPREPLLAGAGGRGGQRRGGVGDERRRPPACGRATVPRLAGLPQQRRLPVAARAGHARNPHLAPQPRLRHRPADRAGGRLGVRGGVLPALAGRRPRGRCAGTGDVGTPGPGDARTGNAGCSRRGATGVPLSAGRAGGHGAAAGRLGRGVAAGPAAAQPAATATRR